MNKQIDLDLFSLQKTDNKSQLLNKTVARIRKRIVYIADNLVQLWNSKFSFREIYRLTND